MSAFVPDPNQLKFNPKNYADDDTPLNEETLDTNISVNPDFYIHLAIIKMQNTMMTDNLNDGLIKYRILGEHLEMLCRAASMLPTDYDEQIRKFKEGEDFKSAENNLIAHTKLANKKSEIILTMFFSKKPIIQTLTI